MPIPVIVLLCVLAVIALLLIICLINAVRAKKDIPDVKPAISWTKDEEDKYAHNLSEMVKCPTISKARGEDYSDFLKYQEVLAKLYPNIFTKLEKHDIEGNILRLWKGSNPDKLGILLMGHQDVVPADQADWKTDPFEGLIKDGIVYGRGAMDCKSTMCCIYSAVEELLESGFVPEQDVWLFSSVNEEVSGGGVESAAEYLNSKGIRLSAVIDEGGAVIGGVFPGLDAECSAVGLLEKGFCNVRFVARSKGGHASTPPKDTPLVRLGKFMVEVEKKDPFKKEFRSPMPEMLASVTPYLKFPLRLVLSNMWLFKGIVKKFFTSGSMTNAFISSTAAFTMSQGSSAENVIPDEAWVMCNIRPSVHQQADETIEILKKIADKYDIETVVEFKRDPSNLTASDSAEYKYLEKCINECLPDTVAVPYLMTGGTDCRVFELVCDNCLRFTPTRLTEEQLDAMHAANENINTSAIAEGTKFFRYYIQNRQK